MKKLFYIKTALVSVMATALFSSCLKDDARYQDFSADAPVVDFPLTAKTSTYVSLQTATIKVSTPTTNIINALISASVGTDRTSAVNVTVSLDAAAMAAASSTYTLLPASTYTVGGFETGTSSAPTVSGAVTGTGTGVITAGGSLPITVPIYPGISQRPAPTVPVVGLTPTGLPVSQSLVFFNINTAALSTLQTANPTTIYVLPLTITGADGGAVIDQYHTLLYKIVVTP